MSFRPLMTNREENFFAPARDIQWHMKPVQFRDRSFWLLLCRCSSKEKRLKKILWITLIHTVWVTDFGTTSQPNIIFSKMRNNVILPIFSEFEYEVEIIEFCQVYYRHFSIYAGNVETKKRKPQKQKLHKWRLLSSTKGEDNRIEL